MGKNVKFYISFNNNETATFVPGNFVSGTVNIEIEKPLKMRACRKKMQNLFCGKVVLQQALRMKFVGDANVYWEEYRHNGEELEVERFSAAEVYFHHKIFILKNRMEQGKQVSHVLPAGNNVFPFKYQLPQDLPSSFESQYGQVRYRINATIDIPFKIDYTTQMPFTVLQTLDLNLDPNAKLPVTDDDSKVLCCLCCASGPIEAELHLDKTGYVPGEFIRINARIENSSSSKISSTKAYLSQKVVCHARTNSREDSYTVADINGKGCAPASSMNWSEDEYMQIPPLPPSFLQSCSIIDISYSLKFVASMPFGSFDMKLKVPVTVGTVPLLDYNSYSLAPTGLSSTFLEPQEAPAPPYQPPVPRYMAAGGNPVDIREQNDDGEYAMGDTNYTPHYVFYDWGVPIHH